MAESILFKISDVQTYDKIADNYEQKRFESYAQEVQRNNLRELLGQELYHDFFNNIGETKYTELRDGKEYEYNGETIEYYGLKPYLCYHWLAVDTIKGGTFKTKSGDAMFVNSKQPFIEKVGPLKKSLISNYLDNATRYGNDIVKFLTENSSTYTLWRGDYQKPINDLSMTII